MKNILVLLAIVLVACFAFAQQNPLGQGPSNLNGGIPESWTNIAPGAGPSATGPGLGRHDLYGYSTINGAAAWVPMGCETCHLPHTAPTYGSSFLWAWKVVPNNVSTYTTDTNPSGSLNTPVGRMANGRSTLCLTCHDGTSASANNITGNVVLQGAPYALIMTGAGQNLGSQHPVDATVPANADYAAVTPVSGGLSASADSVTATIGVNHPLPLWGGQNVECSSCHDQHNDYTNNTSYVGGIPFLRVANTNGVVLCRQCHLK